MCLSTNTNQDKKTKYAINKEQILDLFTINREAAVSRYKDTKQKEKSILCPLKVFCKSLSLSERTAKILKQNILPVLLRCFASESKELQEEEFKINI